MGIKLIRKLALAASLLLALPMVEAGPILEETAPTPKSFIFPTDFEAVPGTGFGDVTAQLFAVESCLAARAGP